jgi:putative aldouronate transport system substrate-binding protein
MPNHNNYVWLFISNSERSNKKHLYTNLLNEILMKRNGGLKMKKSKRFLTLVMTLSMLTLSACGPDSSSNEGEINVSQGNDRSFTAFVKGQDYVSNLNEQQYWIDLAKEKKVDIKVTMVRGDEAWNNQKNALLTSGDVPDVFMGGGAIGSTEIATYKDLFLPLEDLIDKHAPNIARLFKEHPETKAMATNPDGHIYTLSGLQPLRPGNAPIMMINKQWLDKLGLKIPKTLDEFYNVLVAFRDGDPNGNGIKDEVPFDFYPALRYHQGVLSLIGAWGNYGVNNSNVLTFFDDKGKANFYGDSEDFKEFIQYIHKLYKDGLVSKEVLTSDASKYNSRLRNKKVPIVGANIGWTIGGSMDPDYADQYVAIKPLVAKDGVTPIWSADPFSLKYVNNTVSITQKCKNPEAVLEWLDGFYTEDYAVQAFWGSNGVGTKVTEKDGKKYYEQIIQGDQGADTSRYTLSLSSGGPLSVSSELESRITPPKQMQERLQQGSQIYENYWPKYANPISALKLTDADAKELSIIQTDLWSVVDTSWSKWVMKGGIEGEWDGYVAQLKKIGRNRMVEIYQKTFDNTAEKYGIKFFESNNYKSHFDFGYDVSYLK